MKQVVVVINEDGTATSLGNHFCESILVSRRRFSEIVPARNSLRLLFRLLRATFGEQGNVAQWTRTWPCMWRMRVIETGYTAYGTGRDSLIELEHRIFAEMQISKWN